MASLGKRKKGGGARDATPSLQTHPRKRCQRRTAAPNREAKKPSNSINKSNFVIAPPSAPQPPPAVVSAFSIHGASYRFPPPGATPAVEVGAPVTPPSNNLSGRAYRGSQRGRPLTCGVTPGMACSGGCGSPPTPRGAPPPSSPSSVDITLTKICQKQSAPSEVTQVR